MNPLNNEDTLVAILKHTSPADVISLSLVSRTWRNASSSNGVWESFVPEDYYTVWCTQNSTQSGSEANSLTALNFYKQLKKGWLLPSGIQHIGLNSNINKLRFSLSIIDNFSITWGEDRRYWEYFPDESSIFKLIASLLEVCWFEINGTFTIKLPRGRYSVSWRLARGVDLNANRRGLFRNPFRKSVPEPEPVPEWRYNTFHWLGSLPTSTLTFGDEPPIEEEVSITPHSIAPLPGWSEIQVGEVHVGEDETSIPVKMRLTDFSSVWKCGLFIDGVVFQQM